ncbi:TaqI-like C-terminal specificity domain-containing protein [Desulfitobacterium sp.]|uniref:TaqI-like C-terminal specificity domain-containing protein n=1 Tax=Desulfitobacterium sp. TaxID=49981 RepID=UPI002CE81E20|nr:TaqI-like C-terminal specificity domain-containing protein [Desulfitobacterium sp.]HVJ50629.1 TaqI-like C-terminal specificity domain-containing protein [Desulfitobacterium sp.]
MTLNRSNDKLIQKSAHVLQIKEVAALLSVSTATVRNWIKSGRIRVLKQGRSPLFNKREILDLKNEIETGVFHRLKSRRNKRAIKGTFIPAEYVNSEEYVELAERILQVVNESSSEMTPHLILFEVALGLFVKRGRFKGLPPFPDQSLTELAIQGKLHLGSYTGLLNPLCDFRQEISEAQYETLRKIRQLKIPFIPGEDLLGLLYMSLSNLGLRKNNGSYYTPSSIVDSLMNKSLEALSDVSFPKIIDPCCGSGNFLIKLFLAVRSRLLDRGLSLEEAETHLLQDCLTAYDIDEMAITLAKINLNLLRESPDNMSITYKIECRNPLANCDLSFGQTDSGAFDLVIGNPPWGYSFTREEIDLFKDRFITAQASLESFCLFLEYGLSLLKPKGILSYVLPESLLNVQLHTPIRKLLLEKTQILNIHLLGQQFSKVFTPTLTLTVRNSETTPNHEILIDWEDKVKSIPQQRFSKNDRYIFNVKTSNHEDHIIDHMESLPGVKFLKGNADFALGIVTGNNKEWILPQPLPGAEPILKGNDIFKYNFYPSKNYIVFEPQKFQQVAPEQLYRAPEKLLYRFINDNLIFAYDNNQTLSLNSANLVIPNLPGYSIKYILAMFNSRAAQFFHTLTYSSIKVLRKHIESIPIPPCDLKRQQEIMDRVDTLLRTTETSLRADLYEQIDAQVMELYGFNSEQQNVIQQKFVKVNFLSR